MADNRKLHAAKKAKFDEFYTQLSDVEAELKHYTGQMGGDNHFDGKTVYCNCDDTSQSAFWKYFQANFANLHLKRLIGTHYDRERPTWANILDWGGVDADEWRHDPRFVSQTIVQVAGTERTVLMTTLRLEGNGDFRSEESQRFLDLSDIVSTNFPFSLAREFIQQLMDHGRQFLVIAPMNAITYKEVFPLIREGRLWVGVNQPKRFLVPDSYDHANVEVDEDGRRFAKMGNVCWFTNLDYVRRHVPIDLYKRYTPEEYPEYDNYRAINVDRVADIPCDYTGPMGVPISMLVGGRWGTFCPEQFEILDANDYRKTTDDDAALEREREAGPHGGTRSEAASRDATCTGASSSTGPGRPPSRERKRTRGARPDLGSMDARSTSVSSSAARADGSPDHGQRQEEVRAHADTPNLTPPPRAILAGRQALRPKEGQVQPDHHWKAPLKPHGLIKDKDSSIGGKARYARILIRRAGGSRR